MNSLWRRISRPVFFTNLLKPYFTTKTLHTCTSVNTTAAVLNSYPKPIYYAVRYKSKKTQYDSDDEEQVIDNDDSSLSRDSKVVKFNTTSLRTDLILKSALGITRNKIEQHFYESKIRVNGKKILKKSAAVRVGDELDIIKMVSPKNEAHLYVYRVEILSVAAKEDAIVVTARRFKNLLIENYEKDPYKGHAEAET